MNRRLCLSDCIEEYLQHRRQLGFRLEAPGRTLRSLGRYAKQIGHSGPLTTELALKWVQLPSSAAPLWWARRLQIVRQFARFWTALDPRTQVPPAGIFGPAHSRSPVHIYCPSELRALFEATDVLLTAGRLQAFSFRTILGLLACTGVRVSEALRLQDQDIDWVNATLTVRRSKFGRSRCLPVDASVLAQLRSYQQKRRKAHPAPLRPAFFLTAKGRPWSRSHAERTFRRLRAHLGWNQSPLPRLYDFRHAFAIKTLMRWYRQGEDVGSKLLALSAYLGHRNISCTYWYLTAVPELLALGSQRLVAVLEGGIRG